MNALHRTALGALIVLAGPSFAAADAAAAAELIGVWCSDPYVYAFTPGAMTVMSQATRAQRRFPIESAKPDNGWTVFDFGQGRTTAFRVVDGTLIQARNTQGDMGPERRFQRCDWPSGN